MFEFLFKYSLVVYEEGKWFLRSRPEIAVLLLVVAIVLLAVWLAHRQTTAPVQRHWKAALIGLRLVALAILAFCLLEPALSVSTVVSQKSNLLVMVDDSESMAIPDAPGGKRRISQVNDWLGELPQSGSMLQRLSENFQVQLYRFSSKVDAMMGRKELTGKGASTNLGEALAFAARQANQASVSGVVLVSDGAASSGPDPLLASRELTAAQIPVFTIGVGTKIAQDAQIAKVDAAPSVAEHSMVEVTALIQARGRNASTVDLELREGNTLVQRKPVTLNDQSTRVTMQFTPKQSGFARYSLTIPRLPNELVTANNQKNFIMNNRDRVGRILYVEELHPWEYKFIARALDGDRSIRLTSLLKTGPEKYLRLGLLNANELANGFPNSRPELFDYEAVIFGSITASFFSEEQLKLIHDFVAERGGGFMMLGGMRAFSQGGFQTTPIAEILPVELLPFTEADGRAVPPQLHEEFRFTPTPEYLTMPLLQLSADPIANSNLWQQLPLLQGYNPVGHAKAGATVLAVHPLHRTEAPRILMATQRFGRGRTAALATSSTWRWQMRMDHSDLTHERFWRQIARWLSLQSPDPVTVTHERDSYAPGEAVALNVEVMDSSYVAQENANVTVLITRPNQESISLVAGMDLTEENAAGSPKYLANFEAEEQGLHLVEVLAHDRNGRFLGKTQTAFFVEPSQAELSNADLQAPLLQRLAEVTGGRYFHINQSADLPDAITVSRSSFSKLTEHEIWDAPIFFLAITLLLAAEWYMRRSRGLS